MLPEQVGEEYFMAAATLCFLDAVAAACPINVQHHKGRSLLECAWNNAELFDCTRP